MRRRGMDHPLSVPSGRRSEAGFTVMEMVVTLAVFSMVVLAILGMLDINGRIARVEVRVTDMQQSLRSGQQDVVRYVRMAARGGLPLALFPNVTTGYPGKRLPSGLAVEVANNVPAGTRIANSQEAAVLQGTDVLTVRGVFSTLYQSNAAGAGFSLTDANHDGVPEKGSLTLDAFSPTGVPQDLLPLAAAIDASQAGQPGAYLLVSPLDEGLFAVVEIDPSSSYVRNGVAVSQATVRFNASGTTRSNLMIKLSPGGAFPKTLTTVAYSGLLEEYVYYIRDQGPLRGSIRYGQGTLLRPVLARARLYPGTGIPYGGRTSSLNEGIADDVFDLQIALGIDTSGDGVVTEGIDEETRIADEWLFNEPEDITITDVWNGTPAAPRRLGYVRVTTLARTAGADSQTGWQAPPLTRVEDKSFLVTPFDELNSQAERRFRRQWQQGMVDLRNLS